MILFYCIASVLLIIASAITHPLMPQHETMYTGVAWEMWQHHRFFIPLLNGHTYDQKPPLLFWLTHLGWLLFGVNNWWPRIFPGLFGIFSLWVNQQIAKTLWPSKNSYLAALILLGSIYWTICTTQFRFDILVAFFGMLSLYALVLASQKKMLGWWLFGIASGLGILSKGPVLFLYSIPPVILAPFWIKEKTNWFSWYRNFILSLLIAAAILAIWAIPVLSDKTYAKSVLWTQTINRIDHQHTENKPWIFYLYNLPPLFLPWLLWPTCWKVVFNRSKLDSHPHASDNHTGLRLLLISLIGGLIGICLIGPKETRYALTMVPLFALIITRLLEQRAPTITKWDLRPIAILNLILGLAFFASPLDQHFKPYIEYAWIWGVTCVAMATYLWQTKSKTYQQSILLITINSVMIMLIYFFGIMTATGSYHDLRPMAQQVSRLQQQGYPVGFLNSRYQDEFQFYGRLQQPLAQLNAQNLQNWMKTHPKGWVAEVIKEKKITRKPTFSQAFGHNQLILWPVNKKASP